MRKVSFALALLVPPLVAAPTLASEPGTPMDCSDLELAPGLTCSEFSSPGEGGLPTFFLRQPFAAIDNDARILTTADGDAVELAPCGAQPMFRLGLVVHVGEGAVQTPLVSVSDRCHDPSSGAADTLRADQLLFDALRGALFVGLTSSCTGTFPHPCTYQGARWIVRIDGFTPLAEALPAPAPQCGNGVDDDGDGAIDEKDCHCKSALDNDESPARGGFGRRHGCKPRHSKSR
jgi:hypothetical protein